MMNNKRLMIRNVRSGGGEVELSFMTESLSIELIFGEVREKGPSNEWLNVSNMNIPKSNLLGSHVRWLIWINLLHFFPFILGRVGMWFVYSEVDVSESHWIFLNFSTKSRETITHNPAQHHTYSKWHQPQSFARHLTLCQLPLPIIVNKG